MKDTTKKNIIKWFWILFSAPILMVMGLISLVWAFADIPSFEELEDPDSKLATQVIAEDGEYGTEYSGRIDVLNGVPYSIKVECE